MLKPFKIPQKILKLYIEKRKAVKGARPDGKTQPSPSKL